MYNGKILKSSFDGAIQPNYVYVDLNQSISQLYAKDPKIFFEPMKPEADKPCEIFEILVNQKWVTHKMKDVVRDAVKAVKLSGVCAFKTYFYFNDEVQLDEWNDRIQNDDVRTDLILIDSILKDADAPSYEKSPWIAHKLTAQIDFIAKRFGIKDRDEIAKTSSTAGSYDLPDDEKEDFQYGTYWEIEDRRNGQIFYLVDGVKDRVFDVKEKSYPYITMYDFLYYNKVPTSSTIHSDYFFVKDQLSEACLFRTHMSNHARKGSSKYITRGQAFTPEQESALQSADDTARVHLEAGQTVESLQHANLDPQIAQCLQLSVSDIQLILKQIPSQSPVEKTATEIKSNEMAAVKVTNDRLDALEDVMASIATKWAKLMHKNYSSTRVINLTEMTEAEFMGFQEKFEGKIQGNNERGFMTITSKDLSDQVVAKVKAGSTLPDSEQTRISKFMNFGKFVQSIGAQGALDNEEVLHDAVQIFGLENENILKDKDDPYKESKLLSSGVYVPVKMSDDDDYHLMTHMSSSDPATRTPEETLHIVTHEIQKAQKARMQAIMQSRVSSAMMNQPNSGSPITGAASLGMNPNNIPLPNVPQNAGAAMPAPMAGGLPPAF